LMKNVMKNHKILKRMRKILMDIIINYILTTKFNKIIDQ